MEINLNCDLGEKSIQYDGRNDLRLLKIINSANISCGYHAGNKEIIDLTIKLANINNVSIGAHPGFSDKKNFGRKKLNITKKELIKLIRDQLEIIQEIAIENQTKISHFKPHGALNNMACENIDMALTIGQTIREFDKDLIYIILPLNEMENAAKKLDLNYACEIFADRNYEDNGQLIARNKKNALIEDHKLASKNILEMINSSSIKCLSGKKIKCNIDTICIHGDGDKSVNIAQEIKNILNKNGFSLLNLNKMAKFR